MLAVIAASFLLPKLLLVDFYRQLWIEPTPPELGVILTQDFALGALVFLLLRWFLRSSSRLRVACAAAASMLLLAFLLLDVRVRELWLRPLDLSLLSYGWANRSDLGSGSELFFNVKAGWDMTFRRSMVLILGLHGLLWGIFAWLHESRKRQEAQNNGKRAIRYQTGLALGLGVSALIVNLLGGQYRYGLQNNALLAPLVTALRSQPDDAMASSKERFEQVPVPFHETVTAARLALRAAAPFQRLVLVFLESFRWRDAKLLEADGPHPTLSRLAQEGLLSKSYAPVPHSSKGYYAVLSGRYPYPGIEILESVALHQESFVHTLQERLGAETFAFTSMHLAFENTAGLLRSVGLKRQYELEDLLPPGAGIEQPVSSFGGGDKQLYQLTAQRLAAASDAFVGVLLPFGAHYPYEYPGKPEDEGATYQAYQQSLAESDRQLGKMLEHFSEQGLIDETLFVFVGDHGEAFGEHGVFAHNSSVYEEEVAVPAVFWSADGRLKHDDIIVGRQIDIAPTILDLFGYHDDHTPVQGVSLLRAESPMPVYFSTFFDDVALGLLEYPNKYIYEPDSEQLMHFDLIRDPLEAQGVEVSGEKARELISRMRSFQNYQRAAFDR